MGISELQLLVCVVVLTLVQFVFLFIFVNDFLFYGFAVKTLPLRWGDNRFVSTPVRALSRKGISSYYEFNIFSYRTALIAFTANLGLSVMVDFSFRGLAIPIALILLAVGNIIYSTRKVKSKGK